MSRIRVISAAEALYASAAPATGTGLAISQLHRVQSASYSYTVNRTPVNQFAQLAPISREINESPTVSLDFSYLLTNLLNEDNLGFVTDGSRGAISDILNKTEDDRNYYILQVPEGEDAAGYSSAGRTSFGIGNGFITSYSTEAAVNGFATSSVTVEGLNITAYASHSGQTPAINPQNGQRLASSFTIPAATSGVVGQVAALKHGDITLDLGSSALGVDINDAKIQSYTLSFDMNREPQDKLGSKFSVSREITFPVDVTLSVEANVGDIATGDLSAILCNDQEYDLGVTLRKPDCSGSGPIAVKFDLRGAKLDSQSFTSSIGPNKSVTLQWSASLGGPNDTIHNLFMSGTLV